MDALHEDAPRLFMRAAALDGRKAEALQQYDLLVARLKRDLDAEPEDTTRRLAAQIRARAEAVGRRRRRPSLHRSMSSCASTPTGRGPHQAPCSLWMMRLRPIAGQAAGHSRPLARNSSICSTPEIIARLSQTKEFDVISRMSTRAFCGRRARLSDIGAWLGTDYVFWGNCGITRDRLSVRFELAKYRFAIGDLGRQLWTGKAWAEALRMSGVPD